MIFHTAIYTLQFALSPTKYHSLILIHLYLYLYTQCTLISIDTYTHLTLYTTHHHQPSTTLWYHTLIHNNTHLYTLIHTPIHWTRNTIHWALCSTHQPSITLWYLYTLIHTAIHSAQCSLHNAHLTLNTAHYHQPCITLWYYTMHIYTHCFTLYKKHYTNTIHSTPTSPSKYHSSVWFPTCSATGVGCIIGRFPNPLATSKSKWVVQLEWGVTISLAGIKVAK